MKEIAIVCLQHNRHYEKLFTHLLSKIKPEFKELCKLYFFTTNKNYVNIHNCNIETEIWNFVNNDNYGEKINASTTIPCKYIMKLDEDVFLSQHALNALIEKRHLLDDDNIVGIIPITNIGVPTCEYFIKSFCSNEEIECIHKYFLKTNLSFVAQKWNIPEISTLNKFTLEAQYWDFDSFHEAVNQLNTIYKGIHPIRFNFEAQYYLCELVIKHIDKFLKQQNYSEFIPQICHNCNEISFHSQKTFNKIKNIYRFDPYEEVPINRYKRDYNLNFIAINNAYCYTDLYAFNMYKMNNLHEYRNTLYTNFEKAVYENDIN